MKTELYTVFICKNGGAVSSFWTGSRISTVKRRVEVWYGDIRKVCNFYYICKRTTWRLREAFSCRDGSWHIVLTWLLKCVWCHDRGTEDVVSNLNCIKISKPGSAVSAASSLNVCEIVMIVHMNMWRSIHWYNYTDVSEKSALSLFRIESGDHRLLRNIRVFQPCYTISRPRRQWPIVSIYLNLPQRAPFLFLDTISWRKGTP